MSTIVIHCTNEERAKRIERYITAGVVSIQEADVKKLEEENEGLREGFELLEKRLKHLLQSDFVASFDEYDYNKKDYKRDIKEADAIAKWYEEARETNKKICDVFGLPETLRLSELLRSAREEGKGVTE